MNQKRMRITLFMLLLTIPVCLLAQTFTNIESGRFYTAMAKDAANNIYVTRYDQGSDRYQVVKYINGTGVPQVIYGGLQYQHPDYPWGLAVTGNGDVYIAASNLENRVIRLPYNSGSGTYGTAATFLSGKYYSQIATDASNNIYTLEYASATDNYAIVRYPAGSTTGTQLYQGLATGPGYQYPTGLAIAPNDDIYVTDGFDDGTNAPGAVYRFTAASGYTSRTTISSGKYSSSLALDPQGNLYVSEYDGTTYVLNRYNGATGTPVNLRNLLLGNGFYPWGIVALNSQNIYFATGSDGSGGAMVQMLNTPEVQARNVNAVNTTDEATTLSWTNGSGLSRLVFMAAAGTGTPAPVNGTNYTANSSFGSGTQIGGSGWYCVYNGTSTTVAVTGLSAQTTYRVMVVENNGSNFYQTATATNNPFNITTTAALPVTFGPVAAVLRNGGLQVYWSTLSETNNDHFDIQASVDGSNFHTIGTLASKAINGNSDVTLDYVFEKAHAELLYSLPLAILIISLMVFMVFYKKKTKWVAMLLLAGVTMMGSCSKKEAMDKGAGKLYIRIAQVDKDGTTSYSKVIAVQKD